MNILIVGGGVAGAAAATLLAQAGREVLLIEREAAPVHKVCGEFCSGETRAYLAALGLDMGALGGERITHVRLVRGARSITTRLPFEGLGLTRRTLDEALLRHAQAAGAQLRRGQAVRNIAVQGSFAVELGADILHPAHLLLATGKHEARGLPRAAKPGDMVGFKTYFRLHPAQRAALSRHVELILLPGGYAGLQMVEDGAANLSLLVHRAALHRAGGRFDTLLETLLHASPHLAMRLNQAENLLSTPLAIARIPYGFIHKPAPSDPAQLFRLGDQAAVIESFTGDGMAIALHSATLAARVLLAGGTGAQYHQRLAADIGGQLRRAGALHRLLTAPVLGPVLFALAKRFPSTLATSAAFTRLPEPVRLAPCARGLVGRPRAERDSQTNGHSS